MLSWSQTAHKKWAGKPGHGDYIRTSKTLLTTLLRLCAFAVLQSQGAHGDSVDVAHFQAHPRTPVQQLTDRMKEVDIAAAGITAQLTATDSPYLKDVLAKRLDGE